MNTILQGLAISMVAVFLASCGSTPAKPSDNKSVKTHQVKKQPSNAVSASKKATVKKPTQTKAVATAKQVKKHQLNNSQVKKKPKAVSKPRLVAQKRRPAYNKARYVNARPSGSHKHKAPARQIRYAALQGDYARNPRTASFINKMVAKHGFDRGYLNYLFSNTRATPFLKKMAYQDAYGRKKTGKKPRPGRWTRYRSNFLTEKTIRKGVQFWRENRVALKRAEQKYGVPEEYILGIIGVETRYGGNVGKNRAIDALSAMGFNNPRRGKYFRSELESYLLMTRRERLDPLKPMSSYAGALGLSQFMPSNIKRYAVDHDRSGTVNLWTPHDAIGSVANYFKKHGWRKGGTVAVPANYTSSGYKALKTGFKSSHSLAKLRKRGVSASRLGNLSGNASLLKLNTYSGDELWLGGRNFKVITRYNHSTHYAMAVHQLAQAIKGRIGGRSALRQASLDSDMLKIKELN